MAAIVLVKLLLVACYITFTVWNTSDDLTFASNAMYDAYYTYNNTKHNFKIQNGRHLPWFTYFCNIFIRFTLNTFNFWNVIPNFRGIWNLVYNFNILRFMFRSLLDPIYVWTLIGLHSNDVVHEGDVRATKDK